MSVSNLWPAARQQPFIVGVYTDTDTGLTPGNTGFNMAYTQLGAS